ncbi:YHS domain-containing protein [Paenarthrobacter sp. NPDC018779]|uniref:YHS domain-containing protein n=1 Tax=Paenarthrobacter sp. NPDC018779 TaxID=3364375 RepID=UPI0037CB9395
MSNSCCGTNAGKDMTLTSTVSPSIETLPGSETADLVECPVMTGTQVVKADAEAAGLFRDYEGNRYWFCCPGCGPVFDADPTRYAIV